MRLHPADRARGYAEDDGQALQDFRMARAKEGWSTDQIEAFIDLGGDYNRRIAAGENIDMNSAWLAIKATAERVGVDVDQADIAVGAVLTESTPASAEPNTPWAKDTVAHCEELMRTDPKAYDANKDLQRYYHMAVSHLEGEGDTADGIPTEAVTTSVVSPPQQGSRVRVAEIEHTMKSDWPSYAGNKEMQSEYADLKGAVPGAADGGDDGDTAA